MTLDDIAWAFVGTIFTVITVCMVWIIKEERRK